MQEMEHGDAQKAEVTSSCGSSGPESSTSAILPKIDAPQNIVAYVPGISNEAKQRDGGTLSVLADLPSVDFGDNDRPRPNGGGRWRDGSWPAFEHGQQAPWEGGGRYRPPRRPFFRRRAASARPWFRYGRGRNASFDRRPPFYRGRGEYCFRTPYFDRDSPDQWRPARGRHPLLPQSDDRRRVPDSRTPSSHPPRREYVTGRDAKSVPELDADGGDPVVASARREATLAEEPALRALAARLSETDRIPAAGSGRSVADRDQHVPGDGPAESAQWEANDDACISLEVEDDFISLGIGSYEEHPASDSAPCHTDDDSQDCVLLASRSSDEDDDVIVVCETRTLCGVRKVERRQ